MLPDSEEAIAYVNGGDGSMVLDHELVFVSAYPCSIFSQRFLTHPRHR